MLFFKWDFFFSVSIYLNTGSLGPISPLDIDSRACFSSAFANFKPYGSNGYSLGILASLLHWIFLEDEEFL